MNECPKVSILIPVYNTAKYLPECFRSVMNQTLKEIEIIAVNDASPDNAAEVLAEYAARDPRIKVVTHEKNGGILAARISAIKVATGEFVMVLDADDTLDLDIARAAYQKAQDTGADMVHFEFDVKLANGKKTPFARHVQKNLAPYHGTLLNERVFEGAFVDRLYRWNICGKLIKREIFRKAADALPPGYYIMAEDFCFYSLMSFYAKHYEPLCKRGYVYILNVGVSAYVAADRKAFERSCSVFTAMNAVKGFLEQNGVFEKYENAFHIQERLLLGDLNDRWAHRLFPSDRPYGMEYMLTHYDSNAVIASLAETFGSLAEMEDTALRIGMPEKLMRPPAGKPSKIAVYVDDPASDISKELIQSSAHWTDANVTFFSPGYAQTNEKSQRCFPAGRLADSDALPRAERVHAWKTILHQGDFDTVIYAEPPTGDLLWDVLAIKNEGMTLIVIPAYDLFSLKNDRTGRFAGRAAAFRFADAVGCFSKNDAALYQVRGIRSTVLTPVGLPVRTMPDTHTVLWLGNAGDSEQLTLAAAAFSKYLNTDPQANLTIVSPAIPTETERQFHLTEEMLHLENKVRFVAGMGSLSAELEKAKMVLLENGETETAARIRLYQLNVPVLTGFSSQDELAEAMRSPEKRDFTEVQDPAGSWSDLFMSLTQAPPQRQEAGRLFENMLTASFDSAMIFERYAIESPRKGDTFFSFYRFFDSKLGHWFPAGTKRRHYLFAGLRKIFRKLAGKK